MFDHSRPRVILICCLDVTYVMAAVKRACKADFALLPLHLLVPLVPLLRALSLCVELPDCGLSNGPRAGTAAAGSTAPLAAASIVFPPQVATLASLGWQRLMSARWPSCCP